MYTQIVSYFSETSEETFSEASTMASNSSNSFTIPDNHLISLVNLLAASHYDVILLNKQLDHFQ